MSFLVLFKVESNIFIHNLIKEAILLIKIIILSAFLLQAANNNHSQNNTKKLTFLNETDVSHKFSLRKYFNQYFVSYCNRLFSEPSAKEELSPLLSTHSHFIKVWLGTF